MRPNSPASLTFGKTRGERVKRIVQHDKVTRTRLADAYSSVQSAAAAASTLLSCVEVGVARTPPLPLLLNPRLLHSASFQCHRQPLSP